MMTLHQFLTAWNDEENIDLSICHMNHSEFKKLLSLMRRHSKLIPQNNMRELIKWITSESVRLNITANISGCQLSRVDLSHLCLSRFVMKKCYFDHVKFEHAELSGATFDKSIFYLCDFTHMSLDHNTSFKHCLFHKPHCTNIIYSRISCEPKSFFMKKQFSFIGNSQQPVNLLIPQTCAMPQ